MQIDWVQFSPLSAFIGGLMIGLATLIFILFNGRIAGISGITGGLFKPQKNEIAWRIAFIFGLTLSPIIYSICYILPHQRIETNNTILVIAGVLVGVGTRYASGCTSGHGVCGLSRLSFRSLVATCIFMASGFITVFFTHHILAK